MGVVYKALDTKLQRTVALKVLAPSLAADETSRRRFLREARAASSLDHPNICTIFEINETPDGHLFMAMAYYAGDTLRGLLRRGPLALHRALDITIQLGRALEWAHRAGVVHRDIKPPNIMLYNGMVKVLDFGVAKLVGEAGMTVAGETVGTVHYMSPEQAAGKPVDHRTDIWAAAAVFYEMLTGEVPFPADNIQAAMQAIFTRPTPSVVSRVPGTPQEVDWVIAKALAKSRENRYAEISEMVADLEAIRGGRQPVTATLTAVVPPLESPAIAVLPFENRSLDQESEYFSDGLTEELINGLARLEGLRVVSRTSAFEFKKKAQDIRKIGEMLGVQSVLEGSVQKAGNRIRIIAQLTNAATGYHLWSQRYDREFGDIFDVQDDISSSIINALKITFPGTRKLPAIQHPENVEAYQSYLKGRFYWNKKNPAALERARELFEKALEQDPNYALAHCGLADYYLVMGGYWLIPNNEAFPKAKAAALKAMGLEPDLPEPHAALGSVLEFWERDWKGAEKEFRRALDLRPQDAEARLRYGLHFMMIGKVERALVEIRKVVQLDPLSMSAAGFEAMALAYSGQCDAAIRRCEEALMMDPQFVELHYALGIARQKKGLYTEAVEAFEAGAAVSGRHSLILGWLAAAYAAAGRRQDAHDVVKELMAAGERGPLVPLPLAVAYAALGDKDRAFEWLNRAAEAHDGLLCYLQVVPTYDSLRDDPRYTELLDRLGLTPYAANVSAA
jgi:serine/threonine protein kinase/Flp pilus assembly protein TadD